MATQLLPTAYSGTERCFICLARRAAGIRLHSIPFETVKEAYQKHRIIVKTRARCCFRHFDDFGCVRKEELPNIPVRLLPACSTTIKLLDSFVRFKPTPFERFRDLRNLTNRHCKFITGWSKNTLIRFCSFITSIYETERRSKEQLVALYRFWLRKGVTQAVLAKMFNSKTTQSDISDYLDQIRTAIYKDFVPYYLGTGRGKQFFLRHNNLVSKILYQMADDELVIFVDGTYARVEKSANNTMQYSCFSAQKGNHLTKPFIMCCADGYIIDCYGPFKANLNDATIFEYIMENDLDLPTILEPKKTLVIMDRGIFRFNLLF
jgi:hypothetical protein